MREKKWVKAVITKIDFQLSGQIKIKHKRLNPLYWKLSALKLNVLADYVTHGNVKNINRQKS